MSVCLPHVKAVPCLGSSQVWQWQAFPLAVLFCIRDKQCICLAGKIYLCMFCQLF